MNLKDLIPDLRLDPTTLVVFAAVGASVLVFALFLAGRAIWEARPGRRNGGAAEPGTEAPLELPTPEQAKGLWRRFDERFALLAEATGLGFTALEWMGAMLTLALGLAAGLYLWKGEVNFALGGFMAGVAVPAFALWLARRRVRTRLQRQLPDAYFFLARALRAGLSFEQALALAAAETPAPLAPELRRCADQLALGLAPQAALQSAAQRIQLTDFQAFVSVIGLYAAAGGNLAQLLDRLATTTRDRNQYRGYFRSATALSRITAVAIGVAPPLLFLGYVLFEPEMAHRFFASGLGLALLATAFGLELVGLIWLSYLLKVDD